MVDVLLELEEILQSKREKLTSPEANVLMTWKFNSLRDFTIGAAGAGGIAWLATQSLSRFPRIILSAGTAFFCGNWRFGRSVGSCVEHILSLDRSRMQGELAAIMLRKNPGNPIVLQLISKHFYPEIVFADSSPDHPKLRWHHRNSYVDNVAHSQRTQNSDENGSETTNRENNHKQVSRNPAADIFTNPFDCIFGLPASSEEIHHVNTSSTSSSPKRHGHSHRRSRRRHRIHHHEVSSNHQLA